MKRWIRGLALLLCMALLLTLLPLGTAVRAQAATGTHRGNELPILPAYSWADPTYVWSADNSEVTATRECLDDANLTEVETVQTSSSVTLQPTVTEPGETTYVATFVNPEFETQTKTVADIPATGIVKVALIVDEGGLYDGGFNQQVHEAAEDWCTTNNIPYATYVFQDSWNTEQENYGVPIVEQAITEGANVLLLPGFSFTDPTAATCALHPDVVYILMDVSEYSLLEAMGDVNGTLPPNVYTATYREEQAGYLAGYAAVALGYRKLGFLGGPSFPGIMRFGYGFVQGANAAAAALNCTGAVEINYAYTGQFMPDATIVAYADDWYRNGTEIIFACGGGICYSVAAAAADNNAKIIGVDADQKAQLDGAFNADITVTSAVKNMGATVTLQLDALLAGTFVGGREELSGIVSAVPGENPVGLAPSTVYNASFTVQDYAAMLGQIVNGTLVISDDTDDRPVTAITVNYLCYPACDWGDWTSNGDGTHTRVCANDPEHVETEACTFVGGICTVCGGMQAAQYDAALVYDQVGFSVEGVIKAQFAVYGWNHTNPAYDSYFMIITHHKADGTDETSEPIPMDPNVVSGYTIYVGYYDVYATYMADDLDVTVYGVLGDALYSGSPSATSVREIAAEAIRTSSADRATVYANMLAYGAQAQLKFNYNTDDLANALTGEELTAYNAAVTTGDPAYVELAETETTPAGMGTEKVTVFTRGLSVEERVYLQFGLYFGNYDVDDFTIDLKIGTRSVNVTDDKLVAIDGYPGYYSLIVDSIDAVEGQTPVSVTVYEGQTPVSKTYVDTIENLAATKQGDDALLSSRLVNFYRAIYTLINP